MNGVNGVAGSWEGSVERLIVMAGNEAGRWIDGRWREEDEMAAGSMGGADAEYLDLGEAGD